MRRITALFVLICLLLGMLCMGVSAAPPQRPEDEVPTVTAEYENGKVTLTWSSRQYTYVTNIQIGGQIYTASGMNGIGLPTLLFHNTTGSCLLKENPYSQRKQECTFTVEAGLSFSASYDTDAKKLNVNWTSDDYASLPVSGIAIGGQVYSDITETGARSFTVDLSSLSTGTHSFSYMISVGNQEDEIAGDIQIVVAGDSVPVVMPSMEIQKTGDGKYAAVLLDNNGNPIADAAITVSKSGADSAQSVTGSDGVALFDYPCPAEEESQLKWEFDGGMIGGVEYQRVTAVLQTSNSTTTPSSGTTVPSSDQSSTSPSFTIVTASTTHSPSSAGSTTTSKNKTNKTQNKSTTKKTTTTKTTTIKVGIGGTTTALYDAGVMLNALYDKSLLNSSAFGVQEQLFDDAARLYVDKEPYNLLKQFYRNVLMLSVFPTEDKLEDSVLSAALANSEEYGFYSVEDAKSFVVDLGIANVKSESEYTFLDPASIPHSTYTVYLPIPKSFEKCDLAVISLEDPDAAVIEASAHDNGFSFEIDHFGSYAIVAFPAATRTLSVPPLAIVLFVIAGVLFVGAILIFYFFVIRNKPRTAKAGASDDDGRVLLSFGDDEP